MEVLVGSMFGIGRVRDRSSVVAQDQGVTATLFSKEDSSRIGLRRCGRSPAEELSESSSSVGKSSGNEEEEEEDDVSSQGRSIGSFTSSLEDSLPIKRGLSNHYIGKSKSFGNLMEARNAKDLEKMESPLNKRRRLLIANKPRRRSSLSSFSIYPKINPNSMPLLALQETDEDDNKYNDDDCSDDQSIKLQDKRMKMTNNRDYLAQTQSCFSLTSFHDDDDNS